MNRKALSGVVVFVVGVIINGLGIFTLSRILDGSLLSDNSRYAQLFDGWAYRLTGPAMLLVGLILIIAGYYIACKYYVDHEKNFAEEKENDPQQPTVSFAVPVATPRCPLEVTTISYTFCGECGKRNKTGANFCSGCGEKF